MKLFKNILSNQDSIRLHNYIINVENLYTINVNIANNEKFKLSSKFNKVQNIGVLNKKYNSIQTIIRYKKIKDIILKIQNVVKNDYPNLFVNDIFIKRISNSASRLNNVVDDIFNLKSLFNLNTKNSHILFGDKKFYNFSSYCALMFCSKVNMQYGNINDVTCDYHITCDWNDIVFLEKEQFHLDLGSKNFLGTQYMVFGIGYSKTHNIFNELITNDYKLGENIYSDLEIV